MNEHDSRKKIPVSHLLRFLSNFNKVFHGGPGYIKRERKKARGRTFTQLPNQREPAAN